MFNTRAVVLYWELKTMRRSRVVLDLTKHFKFFERLLLKTSLEKRVSREFITVMLWQNNYVGNYHMRKQ